MLRLLLLVSAATASEQLRGGTVRGGTQCNKWIDVKPEQHNWSGRINVTCTVLEYRVRDGWMDGDICYA
jgi:hypothetical protein